MEKDKRLDKNNKEKGWKLGTWNIKSLNGKEDELIQEFEKVGINILAITETKKKGKHVMELDNGHILILSGVNNEERARGGVGCLIEKNMKTYLKKWDCISERILVVQFEVEKQEKLNILILYGPNEDEKAANKDKFWEEVTEIVDDIKGKIVILGDLNGRVGKRDERSREVIGSHGEIVRNNNGLRIIDFCIQNNMVIMNTFFQHKDIHKYTREVKSRNERSIIDYMLIEKRLRHEIKDVRIKRGPEINSDHFLLEIKTNMGLAVADWRANNDKTVEIESRSQEVIKSYKLTENRIAQQFSEKIDIMLETINIDIKELNVEQTWQLFKDVLLKAGREICGTTRLNRWRKQTAWWNNQIKEQVKIKKQKWKQYLNNGNNDSYNEYKEQRKKVKDMVMEAKKKTWEEFGQKIEEDYHTNQKLFYKMLKNIRVGKQQQTIKHMKDKEGKILNGEKEIMERWEQYFKELLCTQEDGEKWEEQVVYEDEHTETNKIELTEVMEAVKMLKKGKAAGHDHITGEMLKNMGRRGLELLTEICNKAWEEGKVPQEWRIGIIVPIFKKGDKRECSNYRGITLLSAASKVYERILERRLTIEIEEHLEKSQSGFRKGHSIHDHIFTIKQITERARARNIEIFQAFIDLEKAFDRVPRKVVEESLQGRKIQERLRKAIMSLYKDNRNYVRTDNMQSQEFMVNEGLRQGGVLSPVLFNLVMDDVMKETRDKTSKIYVGHRNMEPIWLNECAFADDLVVFGKSERELSKNLEAWNLTLASKNLKINEEKTKVMVVGKGSTRTNIELNGKGIDQVDTFKYLGVHINDKGYHDTEINTRIENAARMYHSLKNSFIGKKEVSIKAKMSVYRTVFVPILTFGCESWVLTSSMKSKIQSMEMKYLRRVLGITRKDKIRNTTVRAELQVKPVLERIEDCQLRWFGHLTRMNKDRPVRQVWKARRHEKRTRGRPMKTWDENIENVLADRGLTKSQARSLAQDKVKWRKFIDGAK